MGWLSCNSLVAPRFSDEDYERTFGGKTIAAGLTIRVTPTDDLSSPPEVEVSQEVEAELVKDEVCWVERND